MKMLVGSFIVYLSVLVQKLSSTFYRVNIWSSLDSQPLSITVLSSYLHVPSSTKKSPHWVSQFAIFAQDANYRFCAKFKERPKVISGVDIKHATVKIMSTSKCKVKSIKIFVLFLSRSGCFSSPHTIHEFQSA